MVKKVIVVGAGISGLSCAWKLAEGGAEVTVLEVENYIGGMNTTFTSGEFKLDLGPHKIYTQIDYVNEIIRELLADELLVIDKKSRIRLLGKYLKYPLSIFELFLKISPITSMKFALGFASAKLNGLNDDSYESYLKSRFGGSIYNAVFRQYALKAWGEPTKLSAALAKSRVAPPSIIDMLLRPIVGDRGKKEISAKQFHYPKNGIIRLSEVLKDKIEARGGKILIKNKVKEIKNTPNGFSLLLDSGGNTGAIYADVIVSTVSPQDFVALVGDKNNTTPYRLNHRKLILVFLVVGKERLFEDNWLFYPETKYSFNRIFEQKSFSKYMIPKDKTVLCAEITCSQQDKIWSMDENQIVEKVIYELTECDILTASNVTSSFIRRVDNAYPIYSLGFENSREDFMRYVDSFGEIYSIGRLGYFNYVGMCDCIDMGVKTAEHILTNKGKQEWGEVRKKFENYITID